MFELQASRFVEVDEHGEEVVHERALTHRRPAAARSRRCGGRSRFGYRAEPRLLLASLGTTLAHDAARRPAGAVAQAAHRRRARRRPRPSVVVAAIGLAVSATADVVRQRRSTSGSAAVPRPRWRSPSRRTSPGSRRSVATHRAPGATRATSTAWPCCATRRSRSTTSSSRCSRTSAWSLRLVVTVVLLASIHPALVLLLVAGLPAVSMSLWRPGVERAVEESVAVARPPGPPPVRARHHRRAGQGGARHGHRLEPARRAGAAARERWRQPIAAAALAVGAVHARSAWALFGLAYVGGIAWVARGLDRSVGDIVLVVVAGQRLSQYIAQSVAELGFLRGVWLDSSLRLTWLEDYAAALERARHGRAARAAARRHPVRARLVPLPGHRPAGARRRRRHAARPAPSWRSSARTAPARRRWSSCSPACTGRRPDASRSTASTWRRSPSAGVARPPGRGVPGLLPLRAASPARASASATQPRLDDDAGGRRRGRPGGRRRRRRAAARPGSTPSSARRGTTASRSRFGQWQKLALARGFMRDEPLVLVLDEPTAALDAETEHALFERYAGAARDGAGERPDHRPRLAPLLDRAHGRPHRRARRRARRRGRSPRRADRPRRPVRRAVRHPGRRLPLSSVQPTVLRRRSVGRRAEGVELADESIEVGLEAGDLGRRRRR